MKRRLASPFSMSLLDIMFCGFGAVILLVIILNSQTLQKREAKAEESRSQLDRAVKLEQFALADLEANRQRVEAMQMEEARLRAGIAELEESIGQTLRKTRDTTTKAEELKKSVSELERNKAELRQQAESAKSKQSAEWVKGDRKVGFTGDGRRQYLTGLKLGGERTLILLDASASMLDETIVNIVRRKLMNADVKRLAPKWQRTIRTLHWIIANLQAGKSFQVYAFNIEAWPVIEETGGRWLSTDDPERLRASIENARRIVPQEGTSLYRGLDIVKQLDPAPDTVILLTDGLPTQGRGSPVTGIVSGERRLELFDEAVSGLPKGVSVNTLLFPLEGDPAAAESFWRLAIKTSGSFITPSRDWP